MKEIALQKKDRELLLSLKNEDEFTGRGDIVGEVLENIFKGSVALSSIVNPRAFDLIKQFDTIKKARKQKILRAMKKVHASELVIQKGSRLYLTNKGHIALNKYRIKKIQIEAPKYWDGYFRIVAFDLPVSKHYASVTLTRKLKKMGFELLQNSMYIFPFSCKKEFEQIGKFFNIENNVVYIKTNNLSHYEKYVDIFKEKNIISINT